MSSDRLNCIVWAHSDSKGGTELPCAIAKAFVMAMQSTSVGIVTPYPDFVVDDFFKFEPIKVDPQNVIKSPEFLLLSKTDGRVDARKTYERLIAPPFNKDKITNRFPGLENEIKKCKDIIEKRTHRRTIIISCGEPIAVEVAYQLGLKCVIVTDHLLTYSVRWVLQYGGFFNKEMSSLFTLLEDFDRKADMAFLSPYEFACSGYGAYLSYGGIKCNYLGGLYYSPINNAAISLNPAYNELKRISENNKIVFVFGGGGLLWNKLFDNLHKIAKENPPKNFALLVPSIVTATSEKPERKKSSDGKFLFTLYLPNGNDFELEDPGRLMYWYAACSLVVARGGLAAQQIFATMMSDLHEKPEMLFIEEIGHPQIEHERQNLYNLGFVYTRTLDDFRANPISVIDEILPNLQNSITKYLVSVRYGKEMMDTLTKSLIEIYL